MVKTNYLLQMLRALLFFMVFVYHCELPGTEFFWSGIEVFFCISGYYIFKKLYNTNITKTSLTQIAKKRIIRLWMPDYLATVIFFTIILLLYSKVDFLRLISYILCAQNITWLIEGLGDYAILAHLWTISIEVQTIIIICVIVLILKKLKVSRVMLAPVMMLISLGYVLIVPYLLQSNMVYSLSPISHFFAFAVGGVVLLLEEKNMEMNKIAIILILFGSIGIACISLYIGQHNGTGIGSAFLSLNSATIDVLSGRPVTLTYMFISCIGGGLFSMCIHYNKKIDNKVSNMLVLVGDNSFLLYLLHYPIIYLLFKVSDNVFVVFVGALIITFALHNLFTSGKAKVKNSIVFSKQ